MACNWQNSQSGRASALGAHRPIRSMLESAPKILGMSGRLRLNRVGEGNFSEVSLFLGSQIVHIPERSCGPNLLAESGFGE